MDRIDFTLQRCPADPQVNDPAYQQELTAIYGQLHEAGLPVSVRVMTFDAVGAAGFQLGEFSLDLAKIVGATAVPIIVAWLKYRPGRKITIKGNGINITAERPEDAEHAFKMIERERVRRLGKEAKS